MSNSILHETFHALWDMLFDTIFQMTENPEEGTHIKSRDIYFQQDLHSAFTVMAEEFQLDDVQHH